MQLSFFSWTQYLYTSKIRVGPDQIFLPDAGYPTGLSGTSYQILPDIRIFLVGKLDIRPDNPALPDIRPNPTIHLPSNLPTRATAE